MNLRGGRSSDGKSKNKKKVKPCRRSERNRNLSKEEAKTTKNVTPTKDKGKSKKKYGKKQGSKDDDLDSYELIPPIDVSTLEEVLETFGPSSQHHALASEATMLYECKTCLKFFRKLSVYVKHKQLICKDVPYSAGHYPRGHNPFRSEEMISLFSEDGGSKEYLNDYSGTDSSMSS